MTPRTAQRCPDKPRIGESAEVVARSSLNATIPAGGFPLTKGMTTGNVPCGSRHSLGQQESTGTTNHGRRTAEGLAGSFSGRKHRAALHPRPRRPFR